jgi:hypothetical protein
MTNFSGQATTIVGKAIPEYLQTVALNPKTEAYLFNPNGLLGRFLTMLSKPLKDKNGLDKLEKVVNVVTREVEQKVKTRFDVLHYHLPNLHGIYISGLYILNTKLSKDIPEERKPTLILNNAINGLLAITATYTLMGLTNKIRANFVQKAIQNVQKYYPNLKNPKKIGTGADLFSRFLVTCVIFRYLTPVLATPLADRATKFLIKKGIMKDPNKANKAVTSKPQTIFNTKIFEKFGA